MEVLRKKFQQYSIVFGEYVKLVCPKSTRKRKISSPAEQKRLSSLWYNRDFLEHRKKLVELQGEFETLFLRLLNQQKIPRKYAKELRLLADMVWMWETPHKVELGLEKISSKT